MQKLRLNLLPMLHLQLHQRKAKIHQRRRPNQMLRRLQGLHVAEGDPRVLLALKRQRPQRRNELVCSSHWQLEESLWLQQMSESKIDPLCR